MCSWAHDGNLDSPQRARQRHGVIQEAAIELGDRFNWKSMSQPGLDHARPGCLCHDDQRSAAVRQMCCTLTGEFHWGLLREHSRWPWHHSTPKRITYYQKEDEPCRSHGAPQRTANLRFSNARIIADRHFNDAESRQRAL